MTRQGERDDKLTTADLAGPEQESTPREESARQAGTQVQDTQVQDMAEPRQMPAADEGGDPAVTLLEDTDSAGFQQRWGDVQNRFVDDPRGAVRDADALVAEVMRALAEGFAEHKSSLEEQWSRDDEPDTEQLRIALQRYRFFFSRLLAT
ncbi:MAG: hypothetical protein JWM02_1417 [Frankiales bacterium]|nr:hypothetical protein [Frankiales bacterium]